MKFSLRYLYLVLFCFSVSRGNAQLVSESQLLPSALLIYDSYYYNENLGWVVGNSGYIAKTTDGGQTWVEQVSPITDNLQSVWFTTDQRGWIVGDNETLLKTTDGGNTWTVPPPPSGSSYHLYEVYFIDSDHGWITGSWDNFRTTDGGLTWVPFDATPGTEFKCHFINQTDGWISGVTGYLGYSTNGGVSWTAVTNPSSGDVKAIFVHTMSKVTIATNDYKIFHTEDGGTTWNLVANTSQNIFDLDFTQDGFGIGVGYLGESLVSYDFGETWIDLPFFTSVTLTAINVFDQVAYASGEIDYIYKLTHANNDLITEAYLGLDYVCPNEPVNVIITIYNQGQGVINEADFEIFEGTTSVLNYQWTGVLTGGSYQDINLGFVTVSDAGIYECVISGDSITDNNTSDKFVDVYDVDTDVSDASTICLGDSLEIYADGGLTYNWLNAGSDTANAYQWVAPIESSTYFVYIETGTCKVKDSVVITVDPCVELITAMSPNNDGVNDFLELNLDDASNNSLKIFNRWGDLVNSFTNYDNETVRFDGSDAAGNDLPEGTYYYLFESEDGLIRNSSWIQILR